MSSPDAIMINDVHDLNVQPVSEAVFTALYESDTTHDLLSQPATLGEFERAYLGDELVYADSDMFEAITTERRRLGRTMRAFNRVLNQMLSGTGIVAGRGADSEEEESEGTAAIVGGVEVGKVRRVAGIPILSVRIPLSDGQSVFMMLHSPTSSGNNIRPTDSLTAFRFLLNRKDVTHVVAPIRGRDVSLRQTCMALSNLIEKNSKLFQKKRAFNEQMKVDIESELTQAEQKENELSTLVAQADGLRGANSKLSAEWTSVNEKIADQEAENARLERQYADLVKERDAANRQREAVEAKKAERAKLPTVIEDIADVKAKFDKKKNKKVKLKDGTTIVQTAELDVEVTLPTGEVFLAKFNDTLPISDWVTEGERVFKEAYDFYLSRVTKAPETNKEPNSHKQLDNELTTLIETLSSVTGKTVEQVTNWVVKHQMTNMDVTAFKNDDSLTDDQKGFFIESGIQYPVNDIAVAELVAKYRKYISEAPELVDSFVASDVKQAADILLARSVKQRRESSNKSPTPSTAINASLLILATLGSDSQKEMTKKLAGTNKVKAVDALRVFIAANKILEANSESPLNFEASPENLPEQKSENEPPVESKEATNENVGGEVKPTITAAVALLESMVNYKAADFNAVKEKQSQVAVAVNELNREGVLDEYSVLANAVIDNISVNMKRLGGM